jgi:hypothetical protein
MKSSGMPSIWINEFHINSIFTVSFRAPYTCKQQNKCKVSPYFQPTMHNQFVFSGLGTERKKCPKRKVKETNVTSIGTSEISAVEIVDENLGFPHVQTKECKTGTRGMDSKLVQEKP